MVALDGTAGGSPVGEGLQAIAVFPGELQEFLGVEVGGFLAKESLEAPLDIGALPGTKAIAGGSKPIELEQVPHGKNKLSLISYQF